MTHYVCGMFLYYPCRKPAIRDDLLERTRSASSKVIQAISVANLLQELSEAKTKIVVRIAYIVVRTHHASRTTHDESLRSGPGRIRTYGQWIMSPLLYR